MLGRNAIGRALSVLFFTACTGTHTGSDAVETDAVVVVEPTGCEGAGAGEFDGSIPAFAEIQTIFSRSCSRENTECHTTAKHEGGLDLTAGIAYGQTVNTPAISLDDWVRVKPGDAAHSFLWRKIAHVIPSDQAEDFRNIEYCMMPDPVTRMSVCGGPMPNLDGTPISPPEAALIRAWICAGAPR